MKVDSKNLMEAFTEIKCLLTGIAEVIQMGDDGFEDSIISITDDVKKIINVFQIEWMTPVVDEPKKTYSFLKRYENLHDRATAFGGGDLSSIENGELFSARFYHFIKRELRPLDLSEVKDIDLYNYIIEKVVVDSSYWKYCNSDYERQFYYVVDAVSNEIMEHRRKHPQLLLPVLTTPTTNVSKKLIDYL